MLKIHKSPRYVCKNLTESRLKIKKYSTEVSEQRLKQCFKILKIPPTADNVSIRRAYLKLAKKYHPDSGTTNANKDKFCDIQDAFKALSKELARRGSTHLKVFNKNGYTVPNDSLGQFTKRGHKIKKYVESKDELAKLVHDIVTDFKPKVYLQNIPELGTTARRPNYSVNFPANKSVVLAGNGYSPTWISLHKSITDEINGIKKEISHKRARLGPVPLTPFEQQIWEELVAEYERKAIDLMMKISIYNLILPLTNKPMLVFNFTDICGEILQHGKFKQRFPLVVKTDKRLKKVDKFEICAKYLIRIFVKIKELYKKRGW